MIIRYGPVAPSQARHKHPFLALPDGCRSQRGCSAHQHCLEQIQLTTILHCLGIFFAETISTALKLMTENASLLENNLSFDYHFNAGSLGNICLCLSVSPPADAGNCWEGLLCYCVNWKKAKPLEND